MPTFSSQQLITTLDARVRVGMQAIEPLLQQTDEQLQKRPTNDGWSIVEVLHHLNYYANFYLPAMETAMGQHSIASTANFRSGWFGNYFTNIIGPADENGQLKKKMASPPSAVPPPPSSLNPQKELEEYLAHQRRLLDLLQRAKAKNLNAIRVPISLTKWIKLKLGDTFRFVIAHQERHQQQIKRLL